MLRLLPLAFPFRYLIRVLQAFFSFLLTSSLCLYLSLSALSALFPPFSFLRSFRLLLPAPFFFFFLPSLSSLPVGCPDKEGGSSVGGARKARGSSHLDGGRYGTFHRFGTLIAGPKPEDTARQERTADA